MDSEDKIVDELSLHEKEVLLALGRLPGHKGTLDQLLASGIDSLVKIMNASSWLQSKGLVKISESLHKTYQITKEGQKFLLEKLPERRALMVLMKTKGTLDLRALTEELGKEDVAIALGWLKKRNWATITSDNDRTLLSVTPTGQAASEKETGDELALTALSTGGCIDSQVALGLRKRGLVKEKDVVTRTIMLTPLGQSILGRGIDLRQEVTQLTPELLQTKQWKNVTLRPYDISAFAPALYGGKRHPLSQLIKKISTILIGMGFKEIKGDYVESCFWNMDVLFIPQDHPARDLHDTFYCKNPRTLTVDPKLLAIIADVHETGGSTSSTGWGYSFSKSEAERVVLRTHTTVNTIRYLYTHPEPPSKVFLIGKVFRRENIDLTHLPEFHHVEGIVHEKGANFRQLIGILKEFYGQLGFTKLRFRPGYFPYTEPSMEVEVQWQGKWMELGGSGIFRPEVTEPLGIKEPVLAWGLGLERIAIMYLGLKDIRELYFSDLDWLRKLPLL